MNYESIDWGFLMCLVSLAECASYCCYDGSFTHFFRIEFQPGKSLYTTVRELVENALDSAEAISELPVVEVMM